MTQRIVVVHEANADFVTSTELADRVLIDTVSWLDSDQLSHQREWVAVTPTGDRLQWKTIPGLARDLGIKAHGHFDGEPGEADASAARRAILFLKEVVPDLRAIILVRDQDDQPERRTGLEQARKQDHGDLRIVVGLAVVEREAWVICGFEPRDGSEESARLVTERQTLGFDPRLKSHELTACKNDQAPRSPKRVLQALSGGEWERERECWSATPLDVLRERGGANGLAKYMGEVREHLASLIGHVPEGGHA